MEGGRKEERAVLPHSLTSITVHVFTRKEIFDPNESSVTSQAELSGKESGFVGFFFLSFFPIVPWFGNEPLATTPLLPRS